MVLLQLFMTLIQELIVIVFPADFKLKSAGSNKSGSYYVNLVVVWLSV